MIVLLSLFDAFMQLGRLLKLEVGSWVMVETDFGIPDNECSPLPLVTVSRPSD